MFACMQVLAINHNLCNNYQNISDGLCQEHVISKRPITTLVVTVLSLSSTLALNTDLVFPFPQ